MLSLPELSYWMFLKYENDRKDFVSYLLSLCCSKRVSHEMEEEIQEGSKGGLEEQHSPDLLPYFYCVDSVFHQKKLKAFLDERCSVVAGCCLIRFMEGCPSLLSPFVFLLEEALDSAPSMSYSVLQIICCVIAGVSVREEENGEGGGKGGISPSLLIFIRKQLFGGEISEYTLPGLISFLFLLAYSYLPLFHLSNPKT